MVQTSFAGITCVGCCSTTLAATSLNITGVHLYYSFYHHDASAHAAVEPPGFDHISFTYFRSRKWRGMGRLIAADYSVGAVPRSLAADYSDWRCRQARA